MAVKGGTGRAGTSPCDALGREVVKRFAKHLSDAAARHPLAPADIDRELAAWSLQPQPVLERVYMISWDACERAFAEDEAPRRRIRALERELVRRFEHMLRGRGGRDPEVSRRMMVGLTVALTKLLGTEAFAEASRAARDIAAEHAGAENGDLTPEAIADPRMRLVVNRALVQLAGQIDDFTRRLAEFTRLVNSRLAAPQPDGWDRDWSLDRRTAVLLLQAMYADLRHESEQGGADAMAGRYGPGAPETVARFLASLEQAARLADRPWLLKAIGA